MTGEIERINKILGGAGKDRAPGGVTLAADGTGALHLKDGQSIAFEYVKTARKLFLSIDLLPVPESPDERLAMYDAMLGANFLKLGCGRGALALDRRRKQAACQIGLDCTALTAAGVDRAVDELIEKRSDILFLIEMAKLDAPQAQINQPGAGTAGRLAQWFRTTQINK